VIKNLRADAGRDWLGGEISATGGWELVWTERGGRTSAASLGRPKLTARVRLSDVDRGPDCGCQLCIRRRPTYKVSAVQPGGRRCQRFDRAEDGLGVQPGGRRCRWFNQGDDGVGGCSTRGTTVSAGGARTAVLDIAWRRSAARRMFVPRTRMPPVSRPYAARECPRPRASENRAIACCGEAATG
jgi:hypothetical protein